MRHEQSAVPEVPLSAQEHFLAQARLYTLLAMQVRRYTGGESSSLPSAVARELLASVLFCLDSVPEHAGAWEHILLTQEPEQALAAGLRRLEKNTAQGERLWQQLCCHLPPVENRSMTDTLRSIGTFWKRYDIRFFAHQIPCDIDYQLSIPVSEQLQGVAYVNRYLTHLAIENGFLRQFTHEAMVPVLERYCPDYQGLLINLFAPVAAAALGLCLLNREPWQLRLCMEDCAGLRLLFHEKNHAETENLLVQAAERLAAYTGAEEDAAARTYLITYARTLSPRIQSAAGTQTFVGIFLPTGS